MNRAEHWNAVHRRRPVAGASWFAPHLERSLALVRAVAGPAARILDVGGGASTLVDDLLALGYANLTVLDLSPAALAAARARLGPRADAVRWRVGDVLELDLGEERFEVWHDRAMFHFLTAPAERRAYAELASRALAPGGHAIVATFAADGPRRCSGLDVARYDAPTLERELGPALALVSAQRETHLTPAGVEQEFLYALFRRS